MTDRPNQIQPPMVLARDLVRDEVVLSSRTWVVKVGTSVLTGPAGTLDPARIDHLAEQISTVVDSGRKVAVVSSGAVGAGMGQLGWKRRPDNLSQLQAAAAVGQPYLIRAYDDGLSAPPSSRRTIAPHSRRLRQPPTLPQYAEHPARALRV